VAAFYVDDDAFFKHRVLIAGKDGRTHELRIRPGLEAAWRRMSYIGWRIRPKVGISHDANQKQERSRNHDRGRAIAHALCAA
jgi:hypothetical protein